MSKEAPKADITLGLGWVLFIVFLILKLTHAVAWSWWWVLAPLWVPLGIAALFLGFIALVAVLGGFDCFDF